MHRMPFNTLPAGLHRPGVPTLLATSSMSRMSTRREGLSAGMLEGTPPWLALPGAPALDAAAASTLSTSTSSPSSFRRSSTDSRSRPAVEDAIARSEVAAAAWELELMMEFTVGEAPPLAAGLAERAQPQREGRSCRKIVSAFVGVAALGRSQSKRGLRTGQQASVGKGAVLDRWHNSSQ